MKKTLLAISALLVSALTMAQVDTLTTHFVGNPTIYVPDQVNPQDSGYISGNNAYGDLAKFQLFDATYGVAGGGTVTGVLLGIGVKTDAGGSFQVGIWSDNAGQPGNVASPLAVANVTLASVDTSLAGFAVANGTVFYNVAVNFMSAATIPANLKFWAGVILPTGANELALYSSNLQTNPFADASTHTGEFWGDGTFHTFGDPANWGADVALAIYPVVNFTAGLNENVIDAVVYPNPANNVLNIQAKEDLSSITVTTMDGKVVATSTTSSVNVAELSSGIYMYEAVTVSGKVARGNFAKN